jgi:hypothetical protein
MLASDALPYDGVMVPSSREPWKIWANVLLTIGFGGFFALSLWSCGLIGYYSSKRPREPIPERGWTEPLRWTHGYYGSHDENEQLLRLFDWHLPFFGVAGAGFAIRKLHEKNEPWRAK